MAGEGQVSNPLINQARLVALLAGAALSVGALTVTGNFVQSGATSFATGTGAFTHNGSVTIVTGKTLTVTDLTSGRCIYSTTAGLLTSSANLTFDGTNFAHAGTGTFGTGTGAVALNGNVTIASTKSLTLTGTINSSSVGSVLDASASTTNAKYARIGNDGGSFYIGMESSVGGSFFTSSTAYDACMWTSGHLFLRGATGVAINGAVTMSSTLAIAGALSGVTSIVNAGAIVNSTTGSVLESTNATTSAKYVRLDNTGASGYFGVESSSAGSAFTGSAAYDTCVWTGGRLFLRGGTGVAVNGALTCSSTLTMSGDTLHINHSGAIILFGADCGIFRNAADQLKTNDLWIANGGLQLENTYVNTPQTPTGYITLKDATGTTYKVSCNV